MGIVAIRTLHYAFVYAMLRGHLELRAFGSMAGVAKVLLLFGEKVSWGSRFVNRMAVGTNHVGVAMHRAPYVSPALIFGVTFKTRAQRLLGTQSGEHPHCGVAAAIGHVITPWTMAAFATRALGRFLAGSHRFIVSVFVEVQPHVGVAGFTDRAADILVPGIWRSLP